MTVNSQTLKQQIVVALDTLSFDSLKQQLAADYDDLATMYAELTDELNDDLWLPAENESLLQIASFYSTK